MKCFISNHKASLCIYKKASIKWAMLGVHNNMQPPQAKSIHLIAAEEQSNDKVLLFFLSPFLP